MQLKNGASYCDFLIHVDKEDHISEH